MSGLGKLVSWCREGEKNADNIKCHWSLHVVCVVATTIANIIFVG